MAFDVEGALKAGYTQEEINQFLSQQPQEQPSFDVDGALKAGYTQEEIDEFLVTPQQPTPPQQPVATQPKPVNFDIEGALAAGEETSSAMEEISSSAEEQTASMEEITATANRLGEQAETLKNTLAKQGSKTRKASKYSKYSKS